MDKTIKTKTIMHKADGSICDNTQNVLVENELVLNVCVDGQSSTMNIVCTNSNIEEMVAGRLLTEELISNKTDILNMSVDDSKPATVVDVAIQPSKSEGLYRRDEMKKFNECDIWTLINAFEQGSRLHKLTKSAHSCYLLHNGEIVFCCEDISRHNAVDKTIGFMLLNDINPEECILYTSGRVPLDMIEKVDKAGIPIFVAKAVPTDRSIQFAREQKIVLIARARKDSFEVF